MSGLVISLRACVGVVKQKKATNFDRINSIAHAPFKGRETRDFGQSSAERISDSVAYLSSASAIHSLKDDPYWPKWDAPWWHMTLLYELGRAQDIPAKAVQAMVEAFNRHYLRVFPRPEQLPAGGPVGRYVPCHCGLGTMYQVLSACGVLVDEEIPWIRPWFCSYQLKDGGFNCDERAYSKANGKSSIVSTLPPLEAMLFATTKPLRANELILLDRGASYLIEHRLCRTSAGDKIINNDWLTVCFPRLYHYDVLRGLRFLVSWADIRRTAVPLSAIEGAVTVLAQQFASMEMETNRNIIECMQTRNKDEDGSWPHTFAASTFPLLQTVISLDSRLFLSTQWSETMLTLKRLFEQNLVTDDLPA